MNLRWKGLRRRLIRRRCLEIRLRRKTISFFMCFHRKLYDGHFVCLNRYFVRGNKMLAPFRLWSALPYYCQNIMLLNASAMSSRWLRTVYEIIKIASSESKYFLNSRRVSDVHEKLRGNRHVGLLRGGSKAAAMKETTSGAFRIAKQVHLWWIDPLWCFREFCALQSAFNSCFSFPRAKICFELQKKLYFPHFPSAAWTISAFRSCASLEETASVYTIELH